MFSALFGATPLLVLLLPLTGDLTAIGLRMKQGMEMACEEVRAGGTSVSLMVMDTAGDSARASALWLSLRTHYPDAWVVGPVTHGELRALEALSAVEGSLVSPTAWSEKPGWLSLALSPFLEGKGLARAAAERWPSRRFGVLMPLDSYGPEAMRGFIQGSAIAPVVVMTFASDQVDFRNIFLRMGGVDIEDIKKDMETDRKWLRARMLKVARRLLDPLKASGKVTIAVVEPSVQGQRVLQEDFDKEVIKGWKDVVVQERGWGLNVIPREASRSFEDLAVAAFEDPAVQAVFSPGLREYTLPVEPWLEAAVFIPLPFPRLRGPSVLVSVECTGLLRGETVPQTWQTVMNILPQRRTNPLRLDAVYAPGDWSEGLQQLAQLRFYELGLPVMGSQRWQREEFLNNIGKASHEVWIPTAFFAESEQDRLRDFVQAFEKRYVETPDRYAALGYDAAHLALSFVKEGRRDLRDHAFTYQGVTGECKIEHGRMLERTFFLLTVKKGQWMESITP